MRWLLACGLLCALVVDRWRVRVMWKVREPVAVWDPFYLGVSWLPPDATRATPSLATKLGQARARHESKRSFARLDSLGRARGRFESLLANLRTDLMRGRQNGTKEKDSTSTGSGKSAPSHPIRDY